jgi:hypothetical protein
MRNLTSDHKSFKSRGKMRSDWNVLYIIEKIFWKDIKYFPGILKTNLIQEKDEHPKFWDNMNPFVGTPTWKSEGKVTFGCSPCREAQSIL